MLDRIRTKQANDEGFTLVEMLVVIVVLGILAGITVFGVAQFRSDANASACKSSLKVVSTAIDAYKAKTGNNPTMTQLTDGGYLKEAPLATYGITITDGVASSSSASCA